MASEQVLEEQKEMTKTMVLYDEHDKEMMSVDFVKSDDIDFDGVDQVADQAVRYEIKNNRNEVLDKSDIPSMIEIKISWLLEVLEREKREDL